jgi:hypothetical protein
MRSGGGGVEVSAGWARRAGTVSCVGAFASGMCALVRMRVYLRVLMYSRIVASRPAAGSVPWGIVTNGVQWRVYHREAGPSSSSEQRPGSGAQRTLESMCMPTFLQCACVARGDTVANGFLWRCESTELCGSPPMGGQLGWG